MGLLKVKLLTQDDDVWQWLRRAGFSWNRGEEVYETYRLMGPDQLRALEELKKAGKIKWQ